MMRDAKLIRAGREIRISGGASIGRAADNSICLQGSGVSPYHAAIEERSNGFWLRNLAQVTTLKINGQPVAGERQLRIGDHILVGNDETLVFYAKSPRRGLGDLFNSAHLSKLKIPLAVLMVVISVAGLIVAVGGWIKSRADCGNVEIISPLSGAAISQPIKLRLNVEKPEHLTSVSWQLDGVEFSRANEDMLDPEVLRKQFARLGSSEHTLSVVVRDKSGNQKQPSIMITFPKRGSGPALENLRGMAQDLTATIAPAEKFEFDNRFLAEISRYTGDYQREAITRIESHSRAICRAFHDLGLPPILGLTMALSRSYSSDNSMAWSDSQVEDLAEGVRALRGQFRDDLNDFMYLVSCEGLKESAAAEVNAKLNEFDVKMRRDFTRMKEQLGGQLPPDAMERIARFFAAGIVLRNPREFGLDTQSVLAPCN